MLVVRRIGLAVLALAAVAVFFMLKPSEAEPFPSLPTLAPGATDYAALVDSAVTIYDINNGNAESAPQQQVVNGWLANDLMGIVAVENAQIVSQLDVLSRQNVLAYQAATVPAYQDDRPAALLVIAVLSLALWGATTPIELSARDGQQRDETSGEGPASTG
jgi:hypothetical protein